jgi:hypothetical protein
MKSLKEILESQAEDKNGTVRMYMGPWPEKEWEGGFITTTSKIAAEYRKYQDAQIKKNMGKCPEKADPKGLFKDVKDISGEVRNKWNVYVVFDKNHESAKWGNTLASIVYVDDNMEYDNLKKINEKYPLDRYYRVGGEIRNNVFYMALS